MSVRKCPPSANVALRSQQRACVMAQVRELLARNRRATKRDLFYEHKKLYGTQSNFDRALSALCKHLNTCRNELNVISCSRGFALGNLRLFDGMDDDSVVDFRWSPVPLVDSLCRFNLVHSDAQFLLVVEKDAIFQRLVDEQFTRRFPRSILLTGRGYPDFCTRQFLHWLSVQLPTLPMLVLVDADPYGIEIFLTYKYGSRRSAVEAGPLRLPRLRWLGFLPSEAQTLPIADNQFLPLTDADRKRIEHIGQRINNDNNCNSNNLELDSDDDGSGAAERSLFSYELSVMLNSSHKLELEALCSISANFLSTVYLDNKLRPLNVISVSQPLHHHQQQQEQNVITESINDSEQKGMDDWSDDDWSADDWRDDDRRDDDRSADDWRDDDWSDDDRRDDDRSADDWSDDDRRDDDWSGDDRRDDDWSDGDWGDDDRNDDDRSADDWSGDDRRDDDWSDGDWGDDDRNDDDRSADDWSGDDRRDDNWSD